MRGRFGMASACALAMFSGRIILYFAFVALCGALQTHFHGRGRKGKRQLPRLLPLGGAVAQRLRGYKWRSEKSVKAIAPTGAALAFCASTSSLGLSRASSPWPVAGWVESRGREGGVGTPLPASGPAERLCTLAASRSFPAKVQSLRVRQRLPPRGSWQNRQVLTEGARSSPKTPSICKKCYNFFLKKAGFPLTGLL